MISAVSTDAIDSARSLRVLAADEDEDALERTAALLRRLGHDVAAFAVDVQAVADKVAETDPQAAVVVVHRDDEHALDLIAEIASFASGPVVALVDGEDPEFVRRAAERGVDAVAGRHSEEALQSALELATRRYAESARLAEQVDQLEGALDRRAQVKPDSFSRLLTSEKRSGWRGASNSRTPFRADSPFWIC